MFSLTFWYGVQVLLIIDSDFAIVDLFLNFILMAFFANLFKLPDVSAEFFRRSLVPQFSAFDFCG